MRVTLKYSMLSISILLLSVLAVCQGGSVTASSPYTSLLPASVLDNSVLVPTKFNMGDLKSCVGDLKNYYISENDGLYTITLVDSNLSSVSEYDNKMLDCFSSFGYSGNVESYLVSDNRDLPIGSYHFAEISNLTQPMAMVRVDNDLYERSYGRAADYRAVGYYVPTCNSGDHTLYLPDFKDCLNPERPNVSWKAQFVQNFNCCAIYVKRYFHHDCRLRLRDGTGNPSFPRVSILYARQNYCYTGTVLSMCATLNRKDKCKVNP